jgi:hypothetical protein
MPEDNKRGKSEGVHVTCVPNQELCRIARIAQLLSLTTVAAPTSFPVCML